MHDQSIRYTLHVCFMPILSSLTIYCPLCVVISGCSNESAEKDMEDERHQHITIIPIYDREHFHIAQCIHFTYVSTSHSPQLDLISLPSVVNAGIERRRYALVMHTASAIHCMRFSHQVMISSMRPSPITPCAWARQCSWMNAGREDVVERRCETDIEDHKEQMRQALIQVCPTYNAHLLSSAYPWLMSHPAMYLG